MMATATKSELQSPASMRWGYEFGCDGIVSIREAAKMLGGVSLTTVYRRISEGLLRHGVDGGRAIICRRSLTEYIASLES